MMEVWVCMPTSLKEGATDFMDGDPYSNRNFQTAVRSNRTHG